MSEMGTAMIGAGEAAGDRRAHRAAEAAIANPLFDDASLKGARGVLLSITGGKDLTLYEVDEAASRIREEVDEEANIIVGAIIDPALEQATRVSVVATGIDQSATRRMSIQSFAEPVIPRNIARPSLDQTAQTPFSATECENSASSNARHPISRAGEAASDFRRRDAPRSASYSMAAEEIRRRSGGKATNSRSIGLAMLPSQRRRAGSAETLRCT